jgi:hypothetical protein
LFKGDQAQVMYGHLELEPNLSDLPPAERGVLARAFLKDPGKRWQSCTVFVNELINAQGQAKKPSQATTKSQQVPIEAILGRELCWYCKKNEANGKPEPVGLSFMNLRSVKIEVPRCVFCQQRHSKHLPFYWGPTALPVFVVLLMFVSGFLTDFLGLPLRPKWQDQGASGLLCLGSLVLFLGGIGWASLWRYRWLAKTVADYPSVKTRLDAGWHLDSLSTQNLLTVAFELFGTVLGW